MPERFPILTVPDSLIEASMKDLLCRGFALGELDMMEARGERPGFIARMRAIKVEMPWRERR